MRVLLDPRRPASPGGRVTASELADLYAFPAGRRWVRSNLVTTLRAAGAGLDDVVKTTVFVASSSQDDLVAVWDVVRAIFGDHDAPSTLLGVTVLGYDDQLVEVEAVAVIPAAGGAEPR